MEKKEPIDIWNDRVSVEDTPDILLYTPKHELTLEAEFIEGCKEYAESLTTEIRAINNNPYIKNYDLEANKYYAFNEGFEAGAKWRDSIPSPSVEEIRERFFKGCTEECNYKWRYTKLG